MKSYVSRQLLVALLQFEHYQCERNFTTGSQKLACYWIVWRIRMFLGVTPPSSNFIVEPMSKKKQEIAKSLRKFTVMLAIRYFFPSVQLSNMVFLSLQFWRKRKEIAHVGKARGASATKNYAPHDQFAETAHTWLRSRSKIRRKVVLATIVAKPICARRTIAR